MSDLFLISDLSFLAFPVNVILFLLWAAIVLVIFRKRGDSKFLTFMCSPKAAILSVSLLAVFCLLVGLTGNRSLVSSWPFIALLLFFQTVLAFVILKGWGKMRFILLHLGLLITIASAFLGAPDAQSLTVRLRRDTGVLASSALTEAFRQDGSRVWLKTGMMLLDFKMHQTDEGQSSLSEATVLIDGDLAEVRVNDPYSMGFGKNLYLSAYDPRTGACIFKVVYEPWKYSALVGILMMLTGAVLLFPRKMVSAVFLSLFVILNIAWPLFNDRNLIPVLESPWLIPHVTSYMFSYLLLGCALVLALVGLMSKNRRESILDSADMLTYMGTAFMTFGLLSGAIWAKAAWGHYWNWDPKETWAAATWLLYLVYIHLRLFRKVSFKTLSLIIVLAFLCLQMSWWGVNYLPSAQDSIHIYF